MWQSYKTFPELCISQNWSICKSKKHIQISQGKKRHRDRFIHSFISQNKKKSLRIALLQVWLHPGSETLSSGFNFLLSPAPNAAFLCGHLFLGQDLSTWWAMAARDRRCSFSKLRTPNGRCELLSQELQQKSQVWISLTQRIPISMVTRVMLCSNWPDQSHTPS